ncbi:helix-turn-helix domain-containing protein [Adlercreutzia sp. ZJ242]|uniref:AlbA family DNA-binding domain-containing protein n=1 Tax=Adlercreutzia sp. ZJ242 TaxID=2709409 RepID=UPI0013ED496C|nr:RNA-binding domain-containing protein [Adlercreutzia sp. ZJ242]
MKRETLSEILAVGETTNIEFKRCGQQPEKDTFETVCSFANTFGGSIFLGVEDDGVVSGLKPSALLPIKRNVVNVVNNPKLFDSPVAFEFEQIDFDDKVVLRLWIPPSPNMHRFKGEIYERLEDSDVIVRSASRLAEICIRKQGLYTEQRVYKYVDLADLKLDMLDGVRERAARKQPDHEWARLGNEQLLRSAGLLGKDFSTGDEGLNLAAVLLLGKDEVIRSVCPPYKTDAVWRIDPDSRYDDRIVVRCNLIEAYDLLADFCRKHMPDRFFLDGAESISLRDVIVREVIANCLIHREFTSPYPARMLIDSVALQTENASKAMFAGPITPTGFSPLPKNPIISSFFSAIGLAEELGSGTRNLFKYSPRYSGSDPELVEGTVFTARVPIYRPSRRGADASGAAPSPGIASEIAKLVSERGSLTVAEAVEAGYPRRTVQRAMSKLVEEGAVVPMGNTRSRRYVPAR